MALVRGNYQQLGSDLISRTLGQRRWLFAIGTTLLLLILLVSSHETVRRPWSPREQDIIQPFIDDGLPSLPTPVPPPKEPDPAPKPARVMPICQTEHDEGAYDNLHMSTELCEREFGPELYAEVDAATAYYTARGGISAQDAEEAEEESTVRIKVLNGQVYIKRYGWAPASRAYAMLHAVYRAIITSPERMPDLDFSISLHDAGPPSASRWVLDRTDLDIGKAWLTPDFGLWSWPEPWNGGWRDYRCRTAEVESEMSWTTKADVLFWRGVPMSDNRRELVEVAARHPWGDVKVINWGTPDAEEGKRIPMQDHCRYRYLAQAEGFAYSGRLKYLLMCESVVVSHRMTFTQHFHSLLNSDDLSDDQNIVILDSGGWTGIEGVMADLQEDQQRAQRIARNARETFTRYLSPAANVCYWRRALRAYAEQQRGQVSKDLTGWLDFESMILGGTMFWEPH